MNPQEFKERYQQILEEYQSKKIDWKTFELQLLELKLMRPPSEPEEEGAPASDVSPPGPHSTGRFQLGGLPDENRIATGRRRASRGTAPFLRSSTGTLSSSANRESSQIIRATGPIRPSRRGNRLNIGVKLGNDYRLHRSLEFGPCGESWMAEEIASGSFVVVKPIPPAVQNDTTLWKEYFRTLQRVRSLNFPGISPVFRLAKDDILGYFTVSAYVDAVPLDDYYDQYRRAFHGFPVSVLVRLLWPVAQALDFAHRRGIVHGNVTPNNVLVGKRCGCIVTDFRLPSFLREKLPETCTEFDDNPSWRAPEVLMDGRSVPRSDQYSLGILAYQLIFGRRPFRSRVPEELKEQILLDDPPDLAKLPDGLGAALQKVLSKSPDNRFSSCLDFVAQLDKQGSQEIHVESEESPPQRRSLWAVLFGAAALPESVAGLTLEDLWPFDDSETTVADRLDATAFPYEKSPKGFTDPSKAQTLRTACLTIGSLLGVSLLGGTIFYGMSHLSETKTEPQEKTDVQQLHVPEPSRPAPVVERPRAAGPPPIVVDNGVEAVRPEDVDRLNTLAIDGDVESQRRLGEAYFYGKGLSRDRKRAIEYFQLGAEQEDIFSLYHLARCYELGLGGVQKSLTRAIELYRSAAANGSESARVALERLNARE